MTNKNSSEQPSFAAIEGTPIEQMLLTQRVIIVIGAGGVGKTTSSVALAIHAARLGRRVALLSIDPAKRLAAALGTRCGKCETVCGREGSSPHNAKRSVFRHQ